MIMLCFDVQTVVVFHETSRVMVEMTAVMVVMRIAELIVVRSHARIQKVFSEWVQLFYGFFIRGESIQLPQ